MGQKVNPKGFRLGIYQDWDARWFKKPRAYGKQAVEDIRIRELLEKALDKAKIARIEIERAGNNVRIILHAGLPGKIIGKRGQEIDALREMLAKKLGKSNIEISVQEVKNPELNATLIAKDIAEQLTGWGSYKKAMKKAVTAAKNSGAKGIKICCAGRLGGAEIARTEWARVGSVPLHTLRADIDYGFEEALTTYGLIGIKIWIYRGEVQHV